MDDKNKYNNALEKLQEALAPKDGREISGLTRGCIESIFPELAESKDDRIRKEIIEYIKTGTYHKDWIAWLEKQGKLDNSDTDILNRFSFYSYKDEPNVIYLSELYVNKEHRNKGIGTKILEIADKVAVSMGCNAIRLKTEIDSNAEKLYKRNGYNILKREGNQVWLEKQSKKSVNIDIESMVSSYKQRLESQGNGSMKNNPLVNMCLTAFKHGVEEVLQELNLKEFEKPQGESEIERIRKAVKAIKEEKKIDNENKVEQKFHEGDWIIFNEHHNSVYQVEKIQGLQYYLRHYNGGSMSVYIDSQLIRQWTFADAKDGDVLYSLDSKQPFIFKHRKNHQQAETYCGINIYGKFFVGNTKDCIITTDKYIPATKEQRDTLMKAMADKGWQFDFEKKELKELKKVEQNPAWGQEDEKNLMGIIDEIAVNKSESPESDYETYDRFIDWLKSLRNRVQPQKQWKPSEEQMWAFKQVYDWYNNNFAPSETLTSLCNDLKKLKGK